jgi:transmembrane sensor
MIGQHEIEQRAAEWLVRHDRRAGEPDEQARFEEWLAADSRHRAAYLQLAKTWRESDALKAWRPRDGSVDPSLFRSLAATSSGNTRWPLLRGWSLAFAAMLVIAITVRLSMVPHAVTYSTDVGGYQRVHLDDGSVLQLNTDTQVTVTLAEHRRQLHLIRGEAFFEVAHDPARPFDVIAGTATVHAIGTAFAVHLRSSQDVEVVVTEGRVMVDSALSNHRADAKTPAATPAAVAAGESAVARDSGISVQSIPQPEVTRRLAWQEGELDFKGESLIRVISEFNRYNRKRLEIVDPRLATLEVGGSFRATDLDAFIRALQSSFPVRVQESDGVIRIEARE